MRIGLAQIAAGDDVPANLRAACDAIDRAAMGGADLVVLPEYTMYERKVVDASFAAAAEPLDGPFATVIAARARHHGIAVVVGLVEEAAHEDRPFNTLAVFSPSGELLTRYRKIHLFDAFGFRESEWIAPAPDPVPVVVPIAGMRVGLLTCYDLRFPELSRALVDAGAELLVVAASWVPGPAKAEQWRVLAQARAVENGCFVAAACQAEPISIGRSVIVRPDGTVLGEAGGPVELLTGDVDVDAVIAARRRDPALANRRLR